MFPLTVKPKRFKPLISSILSLLLALIGIISGHYILFLIIVLCSIPITILEFKLLNNYVILSSEEISIYFNKIKFSTTKYNSITSLDLLISRGQRSSTKFIEIHALTTDNICFDGYRKSDLRNIVTIIMGQNSDITISSKLIKRLNLKHVSKDRIETTGIKLNMISKIKSFFFKVLIIILLLVAALGMIMGMVAIPLFISKVHFKLLHINTILLYSDAGFLGILLGFVISISIFVSLVALLGLMKKEDRKKAIISGVIVIIVSSIIIYSQFWYINNNKIYFSSLGTLGITQIYDYKEVTNIDIRVLKGKGGPSINIDLLVKNHRIQLITTSPGLKGADTTEIMKQIVTQLRTEYNVPVSVEKNDYTKYDDYINELLN